MVASANRIRPFGNQTMKHRPVIYQTARRSIYFALLCAAATPFLRGSDDTTDRLSCNLAEFSLKEIAGRQRNVAELSGRNATVIVFLSSECPMSNSYLEPIAQLAERYSGRGVGFVLVNPSAQESDDQLARHATEFQIKLPLFHDPEHRITDALGARVTPEAFVIDAENRVRYQGRVDDQYVTRLKRRDQKTRNDLQIAIDELVAGKPVTQPKTEPIGCPIARAVVAKNPAAPVTFTRDLMKILQARCQNWHQPGQAAPFSLMNYHQAVKWSGDIARVASDRIMPPWKPKSGFGEFRDEQRLTDREIATISAWVDAGMPEGDPADLPAPREFTAGGW